MIFTWDTSLDSRTRSSVKWAVQARRCLIYLVSIAFEMVLQVSLSLGYNTCTNHYIHRP